MTDLTNEQLKLSSAWTGVYEGTAKAVQWIEDVAPNASEVRNVAAPLLWDLYKARNLARSLRRVATTPMGVGFFGLSQAGKSHLINTLAANQEGQLQTQFGPATLNFEQHVNPQGGGAEATGLVTRFTRKADPSPDSMYPLELRLFREVEIAIVLVNAWFEEFDHDTPQMAAFQLSESMVNPVLSAMAERAGEGAPGLVSEDVALLREYVNDRYYGKANVLDSCGYWVQAAKLAPKLSANDRAELFSVLWGKEGKLTDVFRQLTAALDRVGRAETVFASINALVTQSGDNWVRQNSIMNVNTLHLLTDPSAPSVQMRPLVASELKAPVALTVAEITALTSELVFRLIDDPRNEIVNSVDLLDFPGYRTRSKMPSVDRLTEKNAVSNMLLRGKVGYLFERYTEAQEMNALVMCTSSFKQSEVVGVERVLKKWIDTTQGKTPKERGTHAPGLIWVLTMCDGFAETAISGAEAGYPEACQNMIKLTMLERFGNEPWMTEWAPGQAFNNTFLTRAPQFTTFSVKSKDNKHHEEGLDVNKFDALTKLGEALAQNPASKRHIADPEQAWEGMLKLNDGGIGRFSESFKPLADVGFKLQRIEAQLKSQLEELMPRLQPFYEEGGEGELEKQQALAESIVFSITDNHRQYVLGELLHAMTAPAQVLRDIYLKADFEQEAKALEASAQADKPAPAKRSLFGGNRPAVTEAAPAAKPELQSHEHLFARAAVNVWIAHLRQVPERQGLLSLLGLEQETVSNLVRELIRSAERLDVPAQLAKALLQRAQSGVRHDDLVERQILTTRLILDDFAAWFGYMHMPLEQRPDGLLGTADKVFAYLPGQAPEVLPALPAQALDCSVLFADSWLTGVALNTAANTGHRKGREITPQQNDALGKVLDLFPTA